MRPWNSFVQFKSSFKSTFQFKSTFKFIIQNKYTHAHNLSLTTNIEIIMSCKLFPIDILILKFRSCFSLNEDMDVSLVGLLWLKFRNHLSKSVGVTSYSKFVRYSILGRMWFWSTMCDVIMLLYLFCFLFQTDNYCNSLVHKDVFSRRWMFICFLLLFPLYLRW